MDYIEVKISITPFNEDLAECLIAELGEIEFESFTIENELLNAYIQKEKLAPISLKCVINGFESWENVKLSYTTNVIQEQNWNAVWESEFEPIVIENLVTVKAPFHNIQPTKYDIIIEPKMAFGTGHHQTTSLMIKALLLLNGEQEKTLPLINWDNLQDKQVLDMGCGTGVLGFLAAMMGASAPVHGIDVDLTSVNSANENAEKNQLHNKTKILYGDASLIQRNKYDLILANINRNVLLEDMEVYFNGLKLVGGILVVSGFYINDSNIVINRAKECGFVMVDTLTKDDWCSIIFEKR